MKYINLAKKFAQQKYQQIAFASATALVAVNASAADNTNIAAIGTSAAAEIAKFAIMISAIGTAVLSVVVLIQGFRMAYTMIKAGR